MSEKNNVYITTTLPYVNADPHVGFAMEIIRADVLARYHRLKEREVFFNTGTDEHGAKIAEAAEKEGIDPKSYTDRYAEKFRELKELLGLSVDNFVRTTDDHHVMAAQEFWNKCLANTNERGEPDIYKKLYRVKYCVGCELEKTDSELVDGKCPLHPNRELEIREEENYFFRWSRYQKPLLELYQEQPDFVIPDFRGNEVRAFVERGLEDFSISRLKSKMSWGVPVPGDEEHVMYVWFDALVNYISAIGWPDDMGRFNAWWPVIQYCGKDNNRQQSAMWQAMLMSAKLPNSKHIIINGFITSGGQKMSKSLGNVINPFDVIELYKEATPYPEDVLRFTLLHDMPSFEDGDLTLDSIRTSYSANLQNGIGNLTSRIMRMATTHLDKPVHTPEPMLHTKVDDAIAAFDQKRALGHIMAAVAELDVYIQETEPFKVVKTDPEQGKVLITEMVERLHSIANLLLPFIPRTAEEILRLIRIHQMPEKPLFSRLP
jgi:methionyl-tRNA synthetase